MFPSSSRRLVTDIDFRRELQTISTHFLSKEILSHAKTIYSINGLESRESNTHKHVLKFVGMHSPPL
jgi:hypothetical protein